MRRRQLLIYLLDKKERIIENLRKANKEKSERTKKKILDVIKKLEEQKEEITIYKISKLSGVSYNSVKKYLSVLLKEKQV